MKHKTAELEGDLLDEAVALALGGRMVDVCPPTRADDGSMVDAVYEGPYLDAPMNERWRPSRDWTQAGAIIERERITVVASEGSEMDGPLVWSASVGAFSHYIDESLPFDGRGGPDHIGQGPTPIVAAMRAFVTAKLGDEVELSSSAISA